MANKLLGLAVLGGLAYSAWGNSKDKSDTKTNIAQTNALGFNPTDTELKALIKDTILKDAQLQGQLTGATGPKGDIGATGATGTGLKSNLINNEGQSGDNLTLKQTLDSNTPGLLFSSSTANGNKTFLVSIDSSFNNYTLKHFNGTSWIDLMNINSSGTISKIGGGSFSTLSDERLKENIDNFNDGLSKVLSIETKTYNYKKVKGTQTEFYPDFLCQKKQYGVIAQQLKEVCPEMVIEGEDGYFTVDLSNLSLLLVNAVKELDKKDKDQQKLITSQAAKIKALEDQQALILDRLTALEAK